MAIEDKLPIVRFHSGDLCVRPWQSNDAEKLCEAVQSSVASVGRWLPWCHDGYGLEDATAWVTHCRYGWAQEEHFAFAIMDERTGEVLGAAGLNQRNRLHRSANLGYWVRSSRQGEGIATHAASLVARFGFSELGLIRIEIVTLPDNIASRRIAAKIGAKFETLARHRLWVRDQPMDAAVHALIRADMDLGPQPGAAQKAATSA